MEFYVIIPFCEGILASFKLWWCISATLETLKSFFVIVGELFVLLCATWVCEWMDGWMVKKVCGGFEMQWFKEDLMHVYLCDIVNGNRWKGIDCNSNNSFQWWIHQ